MKATFKPVLFSILITLTAFAAVLYTSCKQDKCKSISCAYGGACVDGVCKCLPGYEGSNCETITRGKFIGLYQVHETGTLSPERQYAIGIENDNLDVTQVSIKNLYNYFYPAVVKANVIGDTLIIPNQQLMGKVVFGRGYIYYTQQYGAGPVAAISMRYEIIDTAAGVHTTGKVDDFGFYSDLDNSKPSLWAKYQ